MLGGCGDEGRVAACDSKDCGTHHAVAEGQPLSPWSSEWHRSEVGKVLRKREDEVSLGKLKRQLEADV